MACACASRARADARGSAELRRLVRRQPCRVCPQSRPDEADERTSRQVSAAIFLFTEVFYCIRLYTVVS